MKLKTQIQYWLALIFVVGLAIVTLEIAKLDDSVRSRLVDTNYIVKAQESPLNAPSEPSNNHIGLATWYDYDLQTKDQKCKTQNCYSKTNATCASRDFPRGSYLLVKNTKNAREIICRVNDYGPEEWTGKDIDLSSYAFKQIAPLALGVIEVEILN